MWLPGVVCLRLTINKFPVFECELSRFTLGANDLKPFLWVIYFGNGPERTSRASVQELLEQMPAGKTFGVN